MCFLLKKEIMNAAYFEEILSLSKHDRLLIAQRILESIRLEEEASSSDLSDAWKSELERRSQLLKEGKTKLFSWEEVKAAVERGES